MNIFKRQIASNEALSDSKAFEGGGQLFFPTSPVLRQCSIFIWYSFDLFWYFWLGISGNLRFITLRRKDKGKGVHYLWHFIS